MASLARIVPSMVDANHHQRAIKRGPHGQYDTSQVFLEDCQPSQVDPDVKPGFFEESQQSQVSKSSDNELVGRPGNTDRLALLEAYLA